VNFDSSGNSKDEETLWLVSTAVIQSVFISDVNPPDILQLTLPEGTLNEEEYQVLPRNGYDRTLRDWILWHLLQNIRLFEDLSLYTIPSTIL
jgi:hypothetical protein